MSELAALQVQRRASGLLKKSAGDRRDGQLKLYAQTTRGIGCGRFCSPATMNKPWGLFRSLLVLAPVLVLVPLVSYRWHYGRLRLIHHSPLVSPSTHSLANSRDITVSLSSPSPPLHL